MTEKDYPNATGQLLLNLVAVEKLFSRKFAKLTLRQDDLFWRVAGWVTLLPKIDVPVLIIVGDRDQYTPVSDAQFMHDKIRGSKIAVIDHAGHMPNLEQPDAFNRFVLEFLASALPDVA